jgi:DtxR family Mn-dependent transcriptional regulator
MSRMLLSPTIEDYLKAIFLLENLKKYVRVRDIAQNMNVRLPTVTSMLNNLVERNLVHHEKYEHVELTEEGQRIARDIFCRHMTLKSFLTDILYIDYETAEKDACKMEHAVSPVTLDRLTMFMELIEKCQEGGESKKGNLNVSPQQGVLTVKCLEQMRDLCKNNRKDN